MRESTAAAILPVPVVVNGQTFYWTPAEGLDAAVVAQVEGWIKRRAESYLQAAAMRGLEREDLLQEGRAGALRAAQDYDPAFGVGFLSYADHWIRQSMRTALGRAQDVYIERRALRQALKTNDLPTVLRLDARVADGDAALVDLLPSPASSPIEQAEQAERESLLWRALSKLEPHHRAVLIHRYGLQGPEESLKSVGLRLGCTHEPVRRLQLVAEAKLRALLMETAMPKSAVKPGAKPTAKPPIPNYQPGTQITIDDRIRERERAEAQSLREAREAARVLKKTRVDATKGQCLFPEVVHA